MPFVRVKISKPVLAVLFLWIMLLQVGCSRKERHEGAAGNYYSISVQAPFGVENPSFDWYIRSVPPKSRLSFSDLIMTEEGKQMAFRSDEAGKYVFELVVSNAAGEEAASQTYEFMVEAPVLTPEKKTSLEIEPDTLTPLTADTVTTAEIAEVDSLADTTETAHFEPPIEDTTTATPEKETPAEKVPPRVSKPSKPVRGRKIPAVEGKLTIQVSSWPDLEKARSQAEELLAMGFDAYVQKAYFEETNEVWYRVRIGTFTDYETARRAASEISSVIRIDTWVDRVRVDIEKDQGG